MVSVVAGYFLLVLHLYFKFVRSILHELGSSGMATVIVGTGIIGTSTAYYLSQDSSTTTPSSIHLIESSPELFASASGYAAGFLARNWFSSSVASLGALSFDLHKQLAEENNGREMWGYSRSIGTSLESTGGNKGYDWLREGTSRANAAGEYEPMDETGPAWLTRRKGSRVEIISEDDSTAQVFVPRFCRPSHKRSRAEYLSCRHGRADN